MTRYKATRSKVKKARCVATIINQGGVCLGVPCSDCPGLCFDGHTPYVTALDMPCIEQEELLERAHAWYFKFLCAKWIPDIYKDLW